MGIDLRMANGQPLRFTVWEWGHVLRLALAYDWQPEHWGDTSVTVRRDPEPMVWYRVNGDQTVSAGDAANLAAALERALPDIPEYDVGIAGPKAFAAGDTAAIEKAIRESQRIDRAGLGESLEWLSGPRRQRLVKFIEACRAGPFVIW